MNIPDNLKKYLAETPKHSLDDKFTKNSIESYIQTYETCKEMLKNGKTEKSYYDTLDKSWPDLPKTKEDIQEVLDILTENEPNDEDNSYIGQFISYCVNNVYPEDSIELNVEQPIDFLGCYTKKKWIVNGDVGNWFGQNANSEELTVNGNAGRDVGSYNAGKIIINGDAGDNFGAQNVGTIIINGNAGSQHETFNYGTIIVEKNAEDILAVNNGEILIKGNAKKVGAVQMGASPEGKLSVYGDVESLYENIPNPGHVYIKGKVLDRTLKGKAKKILEKAADYRNDIANRKVKEEIKLYASMSVWGFASGVSKAVSDDTYFNNVVSVGAFIQPILLNTIDACEIARGKVPSGQALSTDAIGSGMFLASVGSGYLIGKAWRLIL